MTTIAITATDMEAFEAAAQVQDGDTFEEKVAKLAPGWTYWPRPELVVPVWATSIERTLSIKSFKEVMKSHCVVVEGPRGGLRKVSPVDGWSEQGARRLIQGLQMRPDRPPGLFQDEDGCWYINTYRRPVHGTPDPAALPVFHKFNEHLVPDQIEREWKLDVWAYKYQHPDIPGPGVMQVAKRQGAGRGTEARMNEQLFGTRYVAKMDASVLFGDSGQSQYTNQICNSVLCQIDEVMSTSANMSVFQRSKTYNRLKMLIEPGKRRMEMIQKNLPSISVPVFASFWMATNNENALPAEQGDRRIAVITNGGPLHENPELYTAMKAFQLNGHFTDGFIAAVAQFLESRDVSRFDPYAPAPMFKGKRLMIDLNTHAVADAVEEVLANLPGDLVTFKDLQDHVRSKFSYGEVPNHLREEVKDAAGRTWIALGNERINEAGSKRLVYARNTKAETLWRETSWSSRIKLLVMNEKPSGVEAMRERYERQMTAKPDEASDPKKLN